MTDGRTRVVEQLLKKYTVTKIYIDNLHADLEDYHALQQLLPAPKVPSLSYAPGSDGKTSNQEEQYCITKEAMLKRIAEIQDKLMEIEPVMKRLDKSLEALKSISEIDWCIIHSRHIEKCSWESIARHTNASIGYCKNKEKRAMDLLNDMIFGPEDMLLQTSFEFLWK